MHGPGEVTAEFKSVRWDALWLEGYPPIPTFPCQEMGQELTVLAARCNPLIWAHPRDSGVVWSGIEILLFLEISPAPGDPDLQPPVRTSG